MKKQGSKRKKTAHLLAMSKAAIRKRVEELRRDWDRLDSVERGDTLRDLVGRGCSIRGLADDLGIPPTTIRRYMTLSALPEADRMALRNGKSAKKALARKAALDLQKDSRERLAEERKSGTPSDQLATIILDFCRTTDGVPETPIGECDILSLLMRVREITHGDFGPPPAPIKLTRNIGMAELFQKTQPPDFADELWLEHRAQWIAVIAISVSPEFHIRETALNRVEQRASELTIPATAEESHRRMTGRYRSLAAGPSQWKQNRGAAS